MGIEVCNQGLETACMNDNGTRGRLFPILMIIILVGIGWNYWLPTVEDYLNLRTRPDYPPNIDFFAYFNAGNRFEDGVNPYYWADTNPENEDYSDFLYPPTVLPLFTLLSRLSYNSARYLWFGIYAGSFLLAFIVSMRRFPTSRHLLFTLLGGTLLLTSYPMLLHIRNGQMDVFIISLILISRAFYMQDRSVPAAFLLAVASLIKISPAFLLIYFVLYRKDIRFLLHYALSITGLILASLLFVPLELYADYFFNILPAVSLGTSYWLNQSIIKLLPEGHVLSTVLSFAGLAAFSLFSLLLSCFKWKFKQSETTKESFQDFLLFYLNLLIVLAFAGKIWSMAYVWMIIPSTILLTHILHRKTSPVELAAAATCILLMNSKVYGYPVLDSLNLIGNLAMTVLLVRLVLRHQAAPIEQ